jgi:chemotaxis protein MotB
MGTGDKLRNGLEVIATDRGVTISVTDKFDFGMFEIGSAVPRKQLVLAMEKISKVLAAEKGPIVINGHTDARPFKSAKYDNWRLSSSRAQSAYYMLVRAGLDELRIREVAGFADRQLKLGDKPLDAANRRIEILLEVDG